MSALSHAQIWGAIDALAARLSMSPSSLARMAGLDSTIFNRSKRLSKERPPRPRWPSTESLAKVIAAAGISFADFAALADSSSSSPIGYAPLMGFNEAAQADHFDPSGYPIGAGWDVALVPGVAEEGAFVLEISGHQLAPIYRDGDRLVVSPSLEARRGDRVVVKTRSGDMRVMQLAQRSAQKLVLAALNPDQPGLTVDLSELVWMSRIVWASQ